MVHKDNTTPTTPAGEVRAAADLLRAAAEEAPEVALVEHLDRLAEVMEYHDAREVQLDGGRPMRVVVNDRGTTYLEWTSALHLARTIADGVA